MPLTNDEGGYAYVARLWANGAQLYHGAWVDRPQGLALLFRLVVAVAPSTLAMRVFAGVYAAASALLLAYVGSRLYGRAAGLCAAALYAVFSSGPQIEGFIVNGELLATLPTVAAVALLLKAQRAQRAGVYVFLAGLFAGAALLIKQSAIDGLVVVALFAWLGVGTDGRARLRWRRCGLVLLGAASALLLSALHGALTGWQDYLNAVVLDNLRYRSFDASPGSLGQVVEGIKEYVSEDGVLVAAALGAVAWALPRRLSPSWLPVVWLAAAVCALNLGGLYNRHYFVQLLPPLCVLAALGLVALVRLVRRRAASALFLAVPLAALAALTVQTDATLYVGSSPVAISQRLYGWPVYTHQAELVALLRRRVPAGAPFFVAYAAAPLHYLTGRPSVTRYLWRRPLGTVPGAYVEALRAVERAVPVCIVAVQGVAQTPGDRRMEQAIARHYAPVWRLPGLAVFCRPAQSSHLLATPPRASYHYRDC